MTLIRARELHFEIVNGGYTYMNLTKKKEYILGVLDGQKEKISDALVDTYVIGYEDGHKDGVEFAKSVNDNALYLRGLNDAWDCIKHICCSMTPEERKGTFNTNSFYAIVSDNTVLQVMDKLGVFTQSFLYQIKSCDDSLAVKPATLADLDLGYALRKLSDWNNPDAKSYVVTFIDYTKGTVDCISTDGMVFQNINYCEMYVVQGEYYEIHLKQKGCKE